MSDRPSSDAHDSPWFFFAKRFIFTSTDGAPFEFIATARGHATAAARSSFNILLQLFRESSRPITATLDQPCNFFFVLKRQLFSATSFSVCFSEGFSEVSVP